MFLENEKGAAANDASSNKPGMTISYDSPAGKLIPIDPAADLEKKRRGNLIRMLRRLLKKNGREIRRIGDRYYVLDVHPCRAIDSLEHLADGLGLYSCDSCSRRSRVVKVETGVFKCPQHLNDWLDAYWARRRAEYPSNGHVFLE